jgi:hypothetical protein
MVASSALLSHHTVKTSPRRSFVFPPGFLSISFILWTGSAGAVLLLNAIRFYVCMQRNYARTINLEGLYMVASSALLAYHTVKTALTARVFPSKLCLWTACRFQISTISKVGIPTAFSFPNLSSDSLPFFRVTGPAFSPFSWSNRSAPSSFFGPHEQPHQALSSDCFFFLGSRAQ